MPFSGSAYFENFWPYLVWAASCNFGFPSPTACFGVENDENEISATYFTNCIIEIFLAK